MFDNSDYAIFWFVAELNLSKNRLRLVESGLSLLKTNKLWITQMQHFGPKSLVDFRCLIHNKWSVLVYTDITKFVQIIIDHFNWRWTAFQKVTATNRGEVLNIWNFHNLHGSKIKKFLSKDNYSRLHRS